MSVEKVVPITKKEGFSFEVWCELLKTILTEDFSLKLSDEHFNTLLANYYDDNYTIEEAIRRILDGN